MAYNCDKKLEEFKEVNVVIMKSASHIFIPVWNILIFCLCMWIMQRFTGNKNAFVLAIVKGLGINGVLRWKIGLEELG